MAQMQMRQPPEPPLYRINEFKGLNLSSNSTLIDDRQSPDMLNFQVGTQGTLKKRTGYEKLYQTSLGSGQINGMALFRKSDGTTDFMIAHGTKLYKQSGTNQPEEVSASLSGNPVNFFTLDKRLYIQDGNGLKYWSGFLLYPVDLDPYVPTLTISRLPSGGGEPYEDFNLVSEAFKDSFSADGTATVYQLSLTGLDTSGVTATVNGVSKTEGTDFTVDRTNGKVTFTTAPTAGTNNVIITAEKTITGFKDRIFKCTLNAVYGGANDTRVFVSGNPDFPNYVWRSGLYEPKYFPENGFYKVGTTNEKVTGFSKQYDYLVIEKERTKWNMNFELNSKGEPTFPIKPLNDQVGTYADKSIQIINNNPVSLDKTGVHVLVSSNVRDERNTQHISANIDRKLLKEPNLNKAISVDFDKKYWLAVNGNVYIYDYLINEWYLFNNINASCFLEKDGYLHFGSNTDGLVYRFKKETDPNPYSDNGVAINAYWYSKLINFGLPERRKLVKRIFYTMTPGTHTSCNLYIRTDVKGEKLVDTTRIDLIDFTLFDFSEFSFITSDIPQVVVKKVKEKKITHLQLKFENKDVEESLEITSLGIKNVIQGEVK